MPIEAAILRDQQCKITTCPKCGKPFEPNFRGTVQRKKRSFNPLTLFAKQDYCALICTKCYEIVGYESPIDEDQDALKELKEINNIEHCQLPLFINKKWIFEINKQRFINRLKGTHEINERNSRSKRRSSQSMHLSIFRIA